ncbi:hypothetical protein CERSUDRAFT_90057 [Gelatoporia subvermispora B]|uniref:Uncharacterized protein n=1 Tax=Ceriporiopsis subvermispora (strain B) TaxID=914234 RepID=M2QWL5_CERS8|nr:hypothetical protein CERSUDRAFT_90057 [Gelatoporia subvermispora B]
MLYSDSTHLTNFGTDSCWPLGLFMGNQSKYDRAKPSLNPMHHVAYIPSMPDTIQDMYMQNYGKPVTAAVLAHCKRELMQAVIRLVLDEHTKRLTANNVASILASSAIQLIIQRTSIKTLAKYPCPRCHVKKTHISEIGNKRDMWRRHNGKRLDDSLRRTNVEIAHKIIFESGVPVNSKRVNIILNDASFTPTHNAFSEHLSQYGMNYFNIFLVDLLHEFELGVWKSVFSHLMRILYAKGGNVIQILNERFHAIPTFGRDTICKFHRNVSAMKKLAARDWEDLLQCMMPVCEGLLPEPHNSMVLDLVYTLATWHARAKMRMHMESSLDHLEATTTLLGKELCRFQKKTCAAYNTKELPQEEAARGRRHAAMVQKNTLQGVAPPKALKGAKRKEFNMNTPKIHLLGHYAEIIREFGMSDNYTTQHGELGHHALKDRYPQTNKHHFLLQLAKIEARKRAIRMLIKRRCKVMQEANKNLRVAHKKGKAQQRLHGAESKAKRDPAAHYHIAKNSKESCDITGWLSEHEGDAALKDFYVLLQDHLLA